MIRLREQTILMLDRSGETAPFDGINLQSDIAACFFGADLREQSFLAEDISLAVEFALQEAAAANPGRAFVKSELDSLVVKVLENSGFPEVASLYSERCGDLKIECGTDYETLEALLSRFLIVSEARRHQIAVKVADALAQLKIASAPHTLILELARFFERSSEGLAEPVFAGAAHPGDRRFVLTVQEVHSLLQGDAECAGFCDSGVLRAKGVSRVFPGVRLVLDLGRFSAQEKLPSPLTELEFQGVCRPLVSACDRAAELLFSRLKEAGLSQSPLLVLESASTKAFAADFLGAAWPQGRRAAREFLLLLSESMHRTVDKLSLS